MAWIDTLSLVLSLQVPIVFGGVMHMIAVKRAWLPGLVRPLSSACFGANKTWRGMLLVPLFSSIGALLLLPLLWLPAPWLPVALQSAGALLLAGMAGGLGYVLAELPNSFIKRRLGVPAGATPVRHRYRYILADQMDSGVGAAVAYFYFPGLTLNAALLYVVVFPVTALVVKRFLFMSGLKSSPA